MHKLAVMLTIIAGLAYQAKAQNEIAFVFDTNPTALDISLVASVDIREHPLGEEVAKKMELLKTRYTYIEPAGPTSPVDKTIVIKPAIYNSIVKLNRFYKSELKDEHLAFADAQKEMLKCLDIALMVYSENTEEFEQLLRKVKEPDEIVDVYNKVSFR